MGKRNRKYTYFLERGDKIELWPCDDAYAMIRFPDGTIRKHVCMAQLMDVVEYVYWNKILDKRWSRT